MKLFAPSAPPLSAVVVVAPYADPSTGGAALSRLIITKAGVFWMRSR